jgi:DNA topoisomerase IA
MSTALSQAFGSEQTAHAVAGQLAGGELLVASREESIVTEPAPLPYTTAELLADANERWGWSGEETMAMAQELFAAGWITYPRSDSTRLDPEAIDAIRRVVLATYGPDLLTAEDGRKHSPSGRAAVRENVPPGVGGTFSTSRMQYLGERLLQRISKTTKGDKDAQRMVSPTGDERIEDAHEAIRPTDPRRSAEDLGAELPQRQLYDLIRRRSLASQMKPAKLRRITIVLEKAI